MNDFSADVKRAINGDTSAFARLYENVASDLYHIALYSLRNSHDACDVVSDTVIDAFSSIGKLRNANAFRSWIMRILSSKIKRKQKEYLNSSDPIELTSLDFSDFDFDSFEIKEALENLDSQSRLLLSLSVLGGYSGKEIAKICNIKPATVRSKLSRIKKQLRSELDID